MPLRVFMVIQRLRPMFSGQGVQVEALSRQLGRRGVDVTVITAARGSSQEVEEIDGYRVRRLRCGAPERHVDDPFRRRGVGPIFCLQAFAYLWRHRQEIDLVHVHALTDALYAAWVFTRLRRIPLLFEMTLLGADDPTSVRQSTNVLRGVRYAIFRRCDGYIAISPALAERYHCEGMSDDKLRIIPQGVDIAAFAPAQDRVAVRRQLGLPEHGPVLTFVGSLIHRKGIDLLLRAWSEIQIAHPEAHLVLVGRNDFGGDLEARDFLTRMIGMVPESARKNLHQTGIRENVRQYLQAADIFLFPSRREGFGSAMIEAMACGLPCIVAELPGITDFIFEGNGRDGMIIPQNDASGLTSAVHQLIANRDDAIEMGRVARQRAVERFAFERIADAYLKYYADLVTSRRRESER